MSRDVHANKQTMKRNSFAADGALFRRCSKGAAVVLVVLLGGHHLGAATITDHFDTPHDYSSGDVSGTIWDGFRAAGTGSSENDTNLVAAEADNATGGGTGGVLHFESSDGDWEHNDNDGLFLFRNVTGDFVGAVQVASATQIDYHDMGIMAREPVLSDAGAGEDYVSVKHFNSVTVGPQNSIRDTDNGSSDNTSFDDRLDPFIQLERSGDTFTFRRKTNVGDAWSTMGTVTRTDLGATLQVGIWHATFVDNVGVATFDDFTLSGPNVPEPSTVVLLLFGGGLALIRRRRRMTRP